jgi:hypothetical protein
MWIPRYDLVYSYQNASVFNTSLNTSLQIMPILISTNATNASLHFQIKPSDPNVGYLFLLKFGQTPILNQTYSSFDYWKVLCPNSNDFVSMYDDTNITNANIVDSYYLFFLDQKQVNNFQGFLGYGLRELNATEMNFYCVNKKNTTKPPVLSPVGNSTFVSTFTTDFSVIVYNGGCYYYEPLTGKWDWTGMKIYADTNLLFTHCSTNHLTQFAGGLVILPSKINFSYAFANASPLKSPIIYAVVITVLCLYVISSIAAYYADKKDKERMGIMLLEDNSVGDSYFYELIVFTGNRNESATDSKVSFLLFICCFPFLVVYLCYHLK